MSTTEPPADGPGATAPLEGRLRHTLVVVADATPITEPADLDAWVPLVAGHDRPAEPRRRWRLAAAAAVALVVIGGALAIGTTRDRTRVDVGPADGSTEPSVAEGPVSPDFRLQDHWHEAYGFYVCDAFLPPMVDAKEDLLGVHTHGDGVIHLHPFSAASSGSNATLGRFGDQIGVTFGTDGWTMPDGTEHRTGTATCGGQPADVVVYRWPTAVATEPGNAPVAEVFTRDFDTIVFDTDREAYTVAVVPRGTTPPRPPSIETLDNLTDVPATSSTTATR